MVVSMGVSELRGTVGGDEGVSDGDGTCLARRLRGSLSFSTACLVELEGLERLLRPEGGRVGGERSGNVKSFPSSINYHPSIY